ncbi:MAG: DedA family protein [bacterium]|nr:DedA family protein [bacterium]
MEIFDSLHDLLARLLAWVESFAATAYGGWALFALAFAESSFFPIPPDVLLIALCIARPELSFWFALVCSIASVLGGMLGYLIGYYGGRPLLKRLFKPQKIRAVESLYDRFNAWATGIAGLTPLPYKIFTIAGGAFAINFKIFVLASAVSRSLRFFAVAGALYLFGAPIKAFIERYLNILSVLFVVFLVLGYWLVTHGFRHASESDGQADADDEEAAVAE